MLANMNQIFDFWGDKGAVAGFNVFGYEDAVAVVRAAERLNCPVMLMTNRDCVRHMPLRYIGPLLRTIAIESKVPVSVHLDHSASVDHAMTAIEVGFNSVMFDGSQLPMEENVSETARLLEFAHQRNVSVEAEIGSVGYDDPTITAKARLTTPDDVTTFLGGAPVDALAVAVGTVHRMVTQTANIDFDLLGKICEKTDTPIVIHGSSGVPDDQLRKLALAGAKKINIGTNLRLAFGNTLRSQMENDPKVFDRLVLFKGCMEAVEEAALHKMELLIK